MLLHRAVYDRERVYHNIMCIKILSTRNLVEPSLKIYYVLNAITNNKLTFMRLDILNYGIVEAQIREFKVCMYEACLKSIRPSFFPRKVVTLRRRHCARWKEES